VTPWPRLPAQVPVPARHAPCRWCPQSCALVLPFPPSATLPFHSSPISPLLDYRTLSPATTLFATLTIMGCQNWTKRRRVSNSPTVGKTRSTAANWLAVTEKGTMPTIGNGNIVTAIPTK